MTNTNLNPYLNEAVDWAPVMHQLSLATGLPDADLRQGTLPYLQSIPTAAELADALLNLLGAEPHALDLIQAFVPRRFRPTPSPAAAYAPPTKGMSYASAIAPTPRPPSPSPPAPAPVPATATAPPSEPTPPINNDPQQPPTATTAARNSKQKKSTPLSVAQFDALNRQGKLTVSKDRAPCNCQAQLHNLLTNCLTCGRIVCVAEGPGPCFTCTSPVLSSTQQLEALAQRITGGAAGHVGEDEQLALARANQDRLLEYDATSAQRTVVIDTKADYVAYEGAGALWLSQAERDRAAKLDRARRKVALHGPGPRAGDAIKLDLDLTRGALEQAKEAEDPVLKALAEDEQEHEDGEDDFEDAVDAYAWNMLESGRVVVKSRSILATTLDQQRPNKDGDGQETGTGAYIHAGLAVRPVYMETTQPDADVDPQEVHVVKGSKGRRRDRVVKARAVGPHVNEQAETSVPTVPGAESLAKKPAAGEGKRKRNRGKAGGKSAATATSMSAGPQEDDPGCG